MDFPAIQSRQLLRILCRKPLDYRVVAQKGSHRKLESDGYPRIEYAWHDDHEVKPRAVKHLFCGHLGLTEQEAMGVIRGRRKQWPSDG